MAKNNNKQKPPNTLLSSQTTHPLGRATSPRPKGRGQVVRTIRNPPKWGFPLGAAALFGPGPCRSDSDKLREGQVGVKWADRTRFSGYGLSCAPGCVDSSKWFNAQSGAIVPNRAQTLIAQVKRLRQISQRVRPRRYFACPAAAPASGRAGSLLAAAPSPRCRRARC
jgi:hypothetical protein